MCVRVCMRARERSCILVNAPFKRLQHIEVCLCVDACRDGNGVFFVQKYGHEPVPSTGSPAYTQSRAVEHV